MHLRSTLDSSSSEGLRALRGAPRIESPRSVRFFGNPNGSVLWVAAPFRGFSMLRRSGSTLAILAAVWGLACGSSTVTTTHSGVSADSGAAIDAPAPDAPRGDAGGRTNDDFGSATPIELDARTLAMEAIERPGDVDFFSFEGRQGQWVVVFTTTMPPAMPSDRFADTVITLYGPDRMPLAENDDALPRRGTDSEIVLRLPSTGTYSYRVQEFSTWAPERTDPPGPRGGAAFVYQTGVRELSEGALQVYLEPDPETGVPIDLGSDRDALVLGRLEHEGDIDTFYFLSTSTALRPELLEVAIMPAGPTGYGATRTAGRMWITDEDGAIVARAAITDQLVPLSPGLLGGMHRLWVEARSGAPGPNDHYVIKFSWRAESPRERSETANGVFASAESRPLTPVTGAMIEQGFMFVRLPPRDVDYFSFEVMAGREVTVACGSRILGSGVLGMRAELRSATDAVLAASTETETTNAWIDAFPVPAAGTYYLRLSASGQDPIVIGDWGRCGIAAAAPMP